jgi:hypothetical protein
MLRTFVVPSYCIHFVYKVTHRPFHLFPATFAGIERGEIYDVGVSHMSDSRIVEGTFPVPSNL